MAVDYIVNMTPATIEVVAKAIAEKATRGMSWDQLPGQFKQEFREQARAAIVALEQEAKEASK